MSALRLLIFGFVAALSFSALRDVWSLDPDAAAYLSLGRSLAAGDGYLLFGEPHAKYPPGLPALFGLLSWLSTPESYALFHAALVLAVLAAAWVAERLALRLGLSPLGALVVAAGTAFSVTFFELSVRYLRTEALFAALSLGSLLACLRALSSRGRWGDALLAALLTIAALSTRLAGVGLLVVPAFALLRAPAPGARPRALLILALSAAGLAAWMTHGASVRAEVSDAPDYRDEFFVAEPRDLTKVVRVDNPPLDAGSLVTRVARNTTVFARATAVLLSNTDKAGQQLPVGAATLALVLLGLGGLWVGGKAETLWARRASVLYVAASVGLLLAWPFDQAERFYAPLLPLLLVAAAEGLRRGSALLGWASRSALGRNLVFAAGLALLGLLALQRSNDPRLFERWSYAYAALLLMATLGVTAAVIGLRRPRQVQLPRWAPWAALALFALPFAHQRLVLWPRVVDDFEARRAELPEGDAFARIDVHPVLETVARRLAAETTPDTVVMTDVPKMLALLSGRRCVPMRYRVDPPGLEAGEASVLFCTGSDPPEAGQVVDALSASWEAFIQLEPIRAEGIELRPTVWRLPPR
ncbi:MAG: hypothetical protein DHS20C15_16200 [Planctomycetota bacterium]|nr:MAG: hypothetical protein DHS20C15_16200 [Planctomycetota bacterium]